MQILRQRRSKGTLRTVGYDGRHIIKEYKVVSWPPDLRRPWVREHKALLRLLKSSVLAPITLGFESSRRTVRYRREYIKGDTVTELSENNLDDLAHHIAAIHAAGVTNGDVALDNLLITEKGEIILIDYGRAHVAYFSSPLFFFNLGKELARIRRRLFNDCPQNWQRFITPYCQTAKYPQWGQIIAQWSFKCWLIHWDLIPATASSNLPLNTSHKNT